MAANNDDLPNDVEALKKLLAERDDAIGLLAARNAYLEKEISKLLRRRTAQSSSPAPADDGQLLFGFIHELAEEARVELEAAARSSAEEDKTDDSSPTSPPGKNEASRNSTGPKKRRGRRRLPNDLNRIETLYEIDSCERQCSCGTAMPRIGEDVAEELVRIDLLFVHRHVRAKYACNKCEDGIMVAPGPQRVLPKSMAGPSLLAWVINSKFGDHLPYYRLEGILGREGAPVSRATLCRWMSGCSELLKPIADQILHEIVTDDYVQTDDTSKLMQRSSKGTSRYGHVWVYTNPLGKVYYDFTETRERHGPNRILGDFEGTVQADAYSGYDELFRGGKAIEAACWAHTKRKFDDARETDPENAGRALAAIKKIYDIEREATSRVMTAEERKQLRKERAPPILEALKTWLQAEQNRVLPKSPIATAIGYTLNQWDALNRYLEDGRIEIDNNRSERMLRAVAVGRKNDLFVFDEGTGRMACILMSLVESCKAIGVEPSAYLNDVLQEMRHGGSGANVSKLTPWAWAENQKAEQVQERRKAKTEALLTAVAGAIARK